MTSISSPHAGMSSSYVRIMASFMFALLGYLIFQKADATMRIIAAYAGWSWFWGLVLFYPAYIRRVHSERFSLLRAYGYFHWGAFYICQSMLFGVLGGGIYRFIKELLACRGKDNTLEKEQLPVVQQEIHISAKELKDLTDVYHKWSTEDLRTATTIAKDQYRPEAIDLMLKELKKREQ